MSFVETLIAGGTLGLCATIIMDVVAVLRQGWGATNGFYCLVGRWIARVPDVGFVHQDIRAAHTAHFEAPLGWGAHILLGALFGVAFLAMFGPSAVKVPQIWQGLSFGLATVLVPWLVFQPLFGWGIAVAKLPNPWKMRLKSVITHGVFGLGLWVSAILLNLAA
ncbi:Protein of unknown function [Aliiroseovarius halocynthiae]|uniref:DUF2938 domain-containing protein n=1 Tax=Aliiroseovarius halocynthiae TaxID=985055 RepID=A0A545SSJ8_9RHOB|nr:DUF2938 family protein [Aliiroseovarius halocynthiae]TQV67915.1 DUF2938 domain-containing protein [Aliiroseovarius halocynthiae]SMR73015.1 Protein of unknown function [Aliiroseovarius halocynthiae]